MPIDAGQIEEGDVLEGRFWHEPIRVVSVKKIGPLVQLESRGLNTKTAYSNLIPANEVGQKITVTRPSGIRFSSNPANFRLAIEALRIRLAHEYDPHFAVSVSQIEPLPHQLEAVYHYILPRPRIRFLLADDPGAGKTIMAGLLLKELKLRGIVERILIVTPANLTDQWRREMKDRFNEVFQVIRRTTLDELYGRNVWSENDQCITSLDFAKRDEVLPTLYETRWDLVIVDEAHKMAAYLYGDELKRSERYRLGELLSEKADHLLFLTATPHKGDPENFRLLMRLLDREIFESAQGFRLALENHEMPLFLRRVKEEMVDFEGHKLFLDRIVKTAAFRLSAPEMRLYQEVTRYVEEQSERAASLGERGRLLGFALALLQRRLASSVRAIRRSLERRYKRLSSLQEHLEQLGERIDLPEDFLDLPEQELWQIEERLERFTVAASREELVWECKELERLISVAKQVERSEEETKLRKLKELLTQGGFFESKTKLLVFTEHRDTLDYLPEKLTIWGFVVTQIHGQMKLGDPIALGTRLHAEKEFREPEGAQIMVATEAAGEGINLHYSCWSMVNYDLPWNPNRLEQRMGRIHRYGQTKDVIIFNLVADDTREGEVMMRLLEKMEEIRRALGTDRVYDVISDVIPGPRLDQLFREALARQRTWEDVKNYIDKAFSPEKVQRTLEEAKSLGLATRHIDLTAIRNEELQAKEQRLMPEYVERFFREAMETVGGRVERRQDGFLRVERVPLELRQVRSETKNRYGPVDKDYRKFTFYKEHLKTHSDAELMGPGHPLFEALLDRVLALYGVDIRNGAVFLDPDRKQDVRIAFFRVAIQDGHGKTIAERLVSLEVARSGYPSIVHPSILIDCKPGNGTEEKHDDVLIDEQKLLVWGYERVFKPYLDEIQKRRNRDLSLASRHVRISLDTLIADSQQKIMKYRRQLDAGEEMGMAIRQEEMRKMELEERLRKRLREMELEHNLSVTTPDLIGVARLMPLRSEAKTEEMMRDEEVERLAMDYVMKFERECGRIPVDVSAQSMGFDIRSEGKGEVLYVEVKGRAEIGDVWLTPNEWQMASRFGSRYWLYVVFNAKTSPKIQRIRDPINTIPVVEHREIVRYIVPLDAIRKVADKPTLDRFPIG